MKLVRRYLLLGLVPFMLLPAQSVAADPLVRPTLQRPAANKPLGVLTIPKLKVTSKVFSGVTMNIFDRGVGQWPGGPAFGDPGNIVIGGHRTSGKRPFYNIDKLAPGDIITLTSRGRVANYAVDKIFIVKPTATWILQPSTEARLTLFSCHPKGSTSRRIVAQATLIQ